MRYESPIAIIELQYWSTPIAIPNILKVNNLLCRIGCLSFSDNTLCFGYLSHGESYQYSPRLQLSDLEEYCRINYPVFEVVADYLKPKILHHEFVHILPFWEKSDRTLWMAHPAFDLASYLTLQQTFDVLTILSDYEVSFTAQFTGERLEILISTWMGESPTEFIPLPFKLVLDQKTYSVKAIWDHEVRASEYLSPKNKTNFVFFGFTSILKDRYLFEAKNLNNLDVQLRYFLEGYA